MSSCEHLVDEADPCGRLGTFRVAGSVHVVVCDRHLGPAVAVLSRTGGVTVEPTIEGAVTHEPYTRRNYEPAFR